MAFKTIKSKFAGTCKRCKGAILPGQSIRWAKGAGAYHLSKECPASQAKPGPHNEDYDASSTHRGQHDLHFAPTDDAGDRFLLGPTFPDHDLIH